MKIIQRETQQITIQREEFIDNFDISEIFPFGMLIFAAWLALSPDSKGLDCENCFWYVASVETNPLFIEIGWLSLGIGLFGLIFQLWKAVKSPTRIRLWDRYTFNKPSDTLMSLASKWSKPQDFGNLNDIADVAVVVEIKYFAEADNPENADLSPESVYEVRLIFADGQQATLERNTLHLSASEVAQKAFQQTITETAQTVVDLREFLDLPPLSTANPTIDI
jgi:hypothetical protein